MSNHPHLHALALTLALAQSSCCADAPSGALIHLDRGDALIFELDVLPYQINAARLALSPNPSQLSFVFLSSYSIGSAPIFEACYQSPDGTSFVAPHPAVTVANLKSRAYQGQVLAISDTLFLSEVDANALFQSSTFLLVLRNVGPNALVGGLPLPLAQQLTVTLAGSTLMTNAPVSRVYLLKDHDMLDRCASVPQCNRDCDEPYASVKPSPVGPAHRNVGGCICGYGTSVAVAESSQPILVFHQGGNW
jgi:hypothetical protein